MEHEEHKGRALFWVDGRSEYRACITDTEMEERVNVPPLRWKS
jgi:hypothetical protein